MGVFVETTCASLLSTSCAPPSLPLLSAASRRAILPFNSLHLSQEVGVYCHTHLEPQMGWA